LNNSQKSRRRSGQQSPARSAYSEWENALPATNIDWETFVNLPMQPPRTHQAVPFNVLNDLRVCPTSTAAPTVANGSSTAVRKGCNDVRRFVDRLVGVFLPTMLTKLFLLLWVSDLGGQLHFHVEKSDGQGPL
jgi:hypothetical protein